MCYFTKRSNFNSFEDVVNFYYKIVFLSKNFLCNELGFVFSIGPSVSQDRHGLSPPCFTKD